MVAEFSANRQTDEDEDEALVRQHHLSISASAAPRRQQVASAATERLTLEYFCNLE